jgi:molybdopterin-containing oxidoreductase family membrane subunit
MVLPLSLFVQRLRRNAAWLFILSFTINIGMWFERFVIIVTSLHRDYLPSSWGMFHPTLIDIGCYTGSLGLFFTLFSLFIRWLPMIAMFEVKAALPGAQPSHHGSEHPAEHGAPGTLAVKEA